jgi:hypothetical protein
MAIDMIENNELSALSPSRVGNDRCFVDEKSQNYLGFTGEEDFYDLFGSKKRKNSIAQVEKDANEKWSRYDMKTCGGIQLLIDNTQVDIETITKRMAIEKGFDLPIQLRIAREAQGRAKALQNQYDCINKLAQEKVASERKSLLDTLTNVSDTAVEKAKGDLKGIDMGTNSANNTAAGEKTIGGVPKNLLIYGGVGLGALIVIALIFKK